MRMFLLALCLMLVLGCGPVIKTGAVVGKNYYPAYDTEEMVVVSEIDTGNGNKMPIYGTETVHHPERWLITIENELNGKMVQQTFQVNQATYESLDQGEWFETE